MGSSSKSSTQATSSEVADSYNQISTNTLTASGTNSLALGSSGTVTNNGKFSLNSNSNNDSNNVIGSNNYTASYGASSPVSTSSSGSGSDSGFDWGSVLVWVVGGVALMLVLRYVLGDKNA